MLFSRLEHSAVKFCFTVAVVVGFGFILLFKNDKN